MAYALPNHLKDLAREVERRRRQAVEVRAMTETYQEPELHIVSTGRPVLTTDRYSVPELAARLGLQRIQIYRALSQDRVHLDLFETQRQGKQIVFIDDWFFRWCRQRELEIEVIWEARGR